MAVRGFVLDCGSLESPDCATIDEIARLQLAARRCGLELRLRNANDSLLDLIGFAGLAGVLRLEPGWQTEQRKEPRRVKEEGELDDSPA